VVMNRRTALGMLSLPGLAAALQQTTSPYRRPKLKITDVKTAFVLGHGPQLHIRIYTDQGLVGQGEATDAALGGAAIIAGWRRFLINQDPLNVEAIWERIRTMGIFAGAQGGQYITALSGLEIALWDLAGKAVGLPIYQLLGGKVRDRVRIYCDSANHHPDDPAARQKIGEIEAMGFTAMKIDIDEATDPARFDRVNWTASNGEIDRMVREVAFVREVLGKRTDLAVDMHGRYDATTGKRVAIELEPFRLLWLEEPVPAENIDVMRDIRQATKTPICCGENLFLRHGFRELLEKRAADIIMPDIQKCGGLLEAAGDAEDCRFGARLQRPVRAALRGIADRLHGLLPRLRGGAELPGAGVALDHAAAALEGLRAGGRDYRKRVRDGHGPAGHRRRDERRCRPQDADARVEMV
jgi:galactonate dehydratase